MESNQDGGRSTTSGGRRFGVPAGPAEDSPPKPEVLPQTSPAQQSRLFNRVAVKFGFFRQSQHVAENGVRRPRPQPEQIE